MRINRTLSTKSGKSANLYIDGPVENPNYSDFYCTIGIECSDISESAKIYGIDKLQALLLAIRHLEHIAQKVSNEMAPDRLFWEFGQNGNQFGLLVQE